MIQFRIDCIDEDPYPIDSFWFITAKGQRVSFDCVGDRYSINFIENADDADDDGVNEWYDTLSSAFKRISELTDE